MELRQLAYFVGIARAGSFSKAANSLRVAQPALSRQMALLEHELGVLLLTRNGRGAIPTSAGETFLPRALEILRNIDEAKWQLASLTTSPSGTIRIGLPLTISERLTPDLLERAAQLFPKISIQVSESWTGHIHRDLLERKLDFGVIGSKQLDDRLIHRTLASERIHLIKAKSRNASPTIRLRDLADIPLVLPPRSHAIRLAVDQAFQRASVVPKIVLESEVWTIIKDVVQKGIACTLLPPREVYRELAAGSLQSIPISKPQILSGLSLARLSATTLPRYADPVFDFMHVQLQKMFSARRESRRSSIRF